MPNKLKGKRKNVNICCKDDIIMLEFNNLNVMSTCLEHVSTFVEGKTTTLRIGHNFSACELKEYLAQTKNNDKDKAWLQELVTIIYPKSKYIIGYVSGDIKTKKHEICHALFHVDETYKKKMLVMWQSLDTLTKERIVDFLSRLGYPPEKHIDEFQAYFNTERDNFFGVGIKCLV